MTLFNGPNFLSNTNQNIQNKTYWGSSGFYYSWAQIVLLRLWVGESVMTSLHWALVRFLVAPFSRCSAISSAMKVFRSTSCRPFLLRLEFEPPPTWVGEPGGPDRTLMLAMAPLKPRRQFKERSQMSCCGWRGTKDLCKKIKIKTFGKKVNKTITTRVLLFIINVYFTMFVKLYQWKVCVVSMLHAHLQILRLYIVPILKALRSRHHLSYKAKSYLPCSAMASRKGCKSVSTEDTVSDDGGRLGESLGVALETLGGGALPHRKLIKSSLRMVLRRFLTQAKTSLLRLWWPVWIPRS